MNIRMDGHMRDERTMDGHLLNNFVLHNKLPILPRVAIKCMKD